MSTSRKLLFSFLILVLIGLCFFAYQNKKELSYQLGSLVNSTQTRSALDTIKKEISTPGGLFAKIESAKAYLTNAGVFYFTNLERTKAGLPKLTSNRTLDVVAKLRLQDMFAKGYFEHVSPSGQSASTVAEDNNYEYITIGENIALGNFEDDEALVAAWMASPGHRANILNAKYTELGVAVGKGMYNGKSTWIGVQIFARPLSLCIKVDTNLKTIIDQKNAEINVLQARITILESEIQTLAQDKEKNRDAYNQKVDEYNALATEINAKIVTLKANIAQYNLQVKTFNQCISS